MTAAPVSAPEHLTPDHDIATFDSGLPELDDWLKRRALQNEASGASRTYVVSAGGRVLDAWLAPDYRYFKLRGADGDTYLVRHDERSDTWELTMFRAKHADG